MGKYRCSAIGCRFETDDPLAIHIHGPSRYLTEAPAERQARLFERFRDIQSPEDRVIGWGPGAFMTGLADRAEWNEAEAALGVIERSGNPYGSTVADIEVAVLALDGNRGSAKVSIELTRMDVERLIERLQTIAAAHDAERS